jgi:hypothetical protein
MTEMRLTYWLWIARWFYARLEEAARAQKIEAATKSVFAQRKTAYEELAKGAE